jgi:hypothetical protein
VWRRQVEGHEMPVLKSTNWRSLDVKALLIEDAFQELR